MDILEIIKNSETETLVLAFVVIVLLVVVVKMQYERLKKAFIKHRRLKRGERGEREALKFLEREGFTILDEQKEFTYILRENDKDISVLLKPDIIAKRDGKVYIVEVKTGTSAPNIRNSSTRRQLLEYKYAINYDGIYLLDMDKRELKEIEFGTPEQVKPINFGILIVIPTAIAVMFLPYLYPKIVVSIIFVFVFYSIVRR